MKRSQLKLRKALYIKNNTRVTIYQCISNAIDVIFLQSLFKCNFLNKFYCYFIVF